MAKWILGAVFLIGLLLRIVNISSLPAGFTPDEASFGYDAYSLLQTGKDQWGHPFPLVLESFGDYKPPLYAYILIPFVGIFGLNETAVRLPNALLGSLAVLVVYFLVLEMKGFKSKWGIRNLKSKEDNLQTMALVAAFILAISPWHVMMSRGAFEANLTTFLMPLGIYAFLRGLKSRNWLIVSAVVFGLNLFSYHSARLVTPMIAVAIFALYTVDLKSIKNSIRNIKKLMIFPVIFGVFLFLAAYSFSLGAGARVADVSIYGGSPQAAAGPRLEAINRGMNPTLAKIRHNRFIVTGDRFINNYKQYYSYEFLIEKGPAEATYGMMPGYGVTNFFGVIMLGGFILAIYTYRKKKELYIILFWLLIAPIPAAMATGLGFAGNRAVVIIPAIQIAMALGLSELSTYIGKKDGLFSFMKRGEGYVSYLALAILILFSVMNLQTLSDYFTNAKYLTADSMLFGRREVVEKVNDIKSEYSTIIVSKSLSEPHIYFAFFNKWDVRDYQRESQDWQRYKGDNLRFLDQLGEYSLGEYNFQSVDYELLESTDGMIFVGKPSEFPDDITPIDVVKLPNGKEIIYFVDPSKI